MWYGGPVDDGYGSGPEDPEEARQRQMDAEDDGNDGLDLSVMDGDERPRKVSTRPLWST